MNLRKQKGALYTKSTICGKKCTAGKKTVLHYLSFHVSHPKPKKELYNHYYSGTGTPLLDRSLMMG